MKKRKAVNYEGMLAHLLDGNGLTAKQAIKKFKLGDRRYFDFLLFFAHLFGYKIYRQKRRTKGKRRNRRGKKPHEIVYHIL